jgi:hypothetical protein
MVSLDALLALATDPIEEPKGRRPRHHWVRGEVRCLMCARLVGRLLGRHHRRESSDGSSERALSFFAFRPADSTQPAVVFTPQIRFRCSECGGAGALDDVEFFSTYDELPSTAEDGEPVRRGPGRPPRPITPSLLVANGALHALSTL